MNIVSIMMVTYNRLELTKKTLDSLFKQTYFPYRLIIVDNGSMDGTVEFLQTLTQYKPYCEGLNLQFNEKNYGIAIGRNQALLIADNYDDDYLSTVDNDIEFIPGWLNECISIIEDNQKFVVGLNFEGVNFPLVTKNNKTFRYKRLGNLGTACTVFNKSLHKEIGFFTTQYGKYGEEDADYFWRARLKGYEMAYLKDDGVHLGQGEFDQGEYRIFKDNCRSNNLEEFKKTCNEYTSGKRSCYLPFIETKE